MRPSATRGFISRVERLAALENQMSGAGDGFPARAEEKVSIEPSELMNGRASNPAELSCVR